MVIVARDGSGDVRSIQEAVDRIAASNESDRRILVKPGTYQERVIIHSDRIHILGEDAESTIITALGCAKDPDENGQEKGTFLSYTVMVAGNDVTMENLTIRNDAGDGRKVGQAVALYTAGDRGRFLRCRLIAHQDTLFCGPLMPKVAQDMLPYQSSVECVPSVGDCPLTYGREYFEQCYIRGDVDFIFGPYRCWFERCTLFMNCRGGWYTAANTPEEQPYGFVFHRCELTGECEEGAAWLGRPWRKYARTVFLQCDMDAHVSPGGFADWDENRLVTERLGEWGTTGARQDLSTRHPRQKRMTEVEAEGITLSAVLGGSDGWLPAAPEKDGERENRLSARVEAFIARLRREDVNMHGFLLSVGGQEKARAYYAPFREGQPHRMYSVSKTMTGIAIGMLIDDGKLGLDSFVADYFKDWLPEKPDGRLLRLTIRDMLRMATCYRRTAYREEMDENWAKAFFTSRPDHEPGTVFYYDTGCSQVLAALVRRLSGLEVMDFLEERLFTPLGCTDERYWLRDPSGCCQGGSGLCMSLRDFHRVAECLLDGGRGIVPAWYVREMGQKKIETLLQDKEEERYGYCWQCWRTRSGWAMYGMGGQLSVICPEKQAILTTIADTRLDPVGVQRIYDAFFEEIYPFIGLEDMRPQVWHQEVPSLADRKEIPAMETEQYIFGDNPLNLKTLRLEKEEVIYENARGAVRLPFRRGQVLQTAYPGWPEVPALVSAGWVDQGLLRIRCHAVGNAPCGFDLLLSFAGDFVTVQSRCSGDPVTVGYDGAASGKKAGTPE